MRTSSQKVKVGLYRHFKGQYYFVQNIALDCTSGCYYAYYFNICHPEYGMYVRPVSEWFNHHTDSGEIVSRPDNVTGQATRFERVSDLNNYLADISTGHLIRELKGRTDSPLFELDIEGLQSSKVFSRDYVVGVPVDTPFGSYLPFFNVYSMSEKDLAIKEAESKTNGSVQYEVYKRVLIKE